MESHHAPSEDQYLDISVALITLNEEDNLDRCLASLPRGCEVILVDSGSTDQTLAIAKSYGAKIFHRPFRNYADQKNFAIAQASRTWVLSLDADEVLSPDLSERFVTISSSPEQDSRAAYRINRRLVFMGRVMRWGKTTDAPLRFFRRGRASFDGEIHERLKVDGEVDRLKVGCLWHYSYRDLSDYFARFNRYTSEIANCHIRLGHQPSRLGHCFRPWLEFVSRYVFRLGFLDGYPGYTYALISSLYAYVKYAKLFEMNHKSHQTHIGPSR